MKCSLKAVRTFGAALIAFGSLAGGANAAIILTNLGGSQYRVQVDPIVFTVTTAQSAGNRFIIEDFYAVSASQSGADISGGMTWKLNDGPTIFIDVETFTGVFAGTIVEIDANDLLVNYVIDYFSAGASSIEPGDTVTVTADFIFQTDSPLSPFGSGPYVAKLLNFGTSISQTSIPEPTSTLLLGFGVLGIVIRRKR